MGVKTEITLAYANRLFDSYEFIKLIPTTSGIVDTTYIVNTKDNSYILKKYERNIKEKIQKDIRLLKKLKNYDLNVSTCHDVNGEWHLYEKLKGSQPRVIKSYHIVELARFLAKLHTIMREKNPPQEFEELQNILDALVYAKQNYFFYYKKFEHLKNYKAQNDGVIHGDIFKDNTVFYKSKVGVFDFIDSVYGSFYFDIAVLLVAFGAKNNNYYVNLFLNTYNQHVSKKLNKKELKEFLKTASHFYSLKRLYNYKNSTLSKELL